MKRTPEVMRVLGSSCEFWSIFLVSPTCTDTNSLQGLQGEAEAQFNGLGRVDG